MLGSVLGGFMMGGSSLLLSVTQREGGTHLRERARQHPGYTADQWRDRLPRKAAGLQARTFHAGLRAITQLPPPA